MDDGIVEQVRRDRWGRYLVVPPDGKKPVGYTRATTIAKTLDDTSALMSWGERMVAIGLSQRPDLLAGVDDVRSDSKALNRLCEKAKEAGGATVRRDLGTALHSILERAWLDDDYVPPAAHVDDVNAVQRQLALAGLEPVDGMNERIVVSDRYKIAGTFDLLLKDRVSGEQYVADIKTGSSVKYGSVAFSIQLSIYANADAVYEQGVAADGSQDRRSAMPEVSKSRAVIIHVEPGSGVCELHWLRLDADLLSLAVAVREARRSQMLEPLTAADLPDSSEDDRWLRKRIAAIREANPKMLAARWVAHIPPPKKIDRFDMAQIEELIPIIDRLEADLELPFTEPRPGTVLVTPRIEPVEPSVSNDPDEGSLLPGEAELLRAQFEGLTVEQREWLSGVVKEAHDAHLPIRVAERPTARRVHLASALFYMIRYDISVEQARDLLAVALADDSVRMATLPFGAALGVCSAKQAADFRELCGLGTTVTTGGDK